MEIKFDELLKECESVSLSMSECVETLVMRDQSKSKLWYKFSAGRITASRMKAVCHTKVAKPLQSLINTLTSVYTLNISKQT